MRKAKKLQRQLAIEKCVAEERADALMVVNADCHQLREARDTLTATLRRADTYRSARQPAVESDRVVLAIVAAIMRKLAVQEISIKLSRDDLPDNPPPIVVYHDRNIYESVSEYHFRFRDKHDDGEPHRINLLPLKGQIGQ